MSTTIYRLRLKKVWDDDNRRCFHITDVGLFTSKELAMTCAFDHVIALKHKISEKNDGKIPNKYHFTDLSEIDLFGGRGRKHFIKEDIDKPESHSSALWYLYIEEKILYDNTNLTFDNYYWDSLI